MLLRVVCFWQLARAGKYTDVLALLAEAWTKRTCMLDSTHMRTAHCALRERESESEHARERESEKRERDGAGGIPKAWHANSMSTTGMS